MDHTYFELPDGRWQCCDCGAIGETKETIHHYPNCQPGCAELWQKFYDENDSIFSIYEED